MATQIQIGKTNTNWQKKYKFGYTNTTWEQKSWCFSGDDLPYHQHLIDIYSFLSMFDTYMQNLLTSGENDD